MCKTKFVFSFFLLISSGLNIQGSAHDNTLSQIDQTKVLFGETVITKNFLLTLESWENNITQEFISNILDAYQEFHRKFIISKSLCSYEALAEDFYEKNSSATGLLKEYFFCDQTAEELFQKRIDELLNPVKLNIHKWFDAMRRFEFDQLKIPNRFFVNG